MEKDLLLNLIEESYPQLMDDEDKLIELIDHVEATTGKTAVVLGSKQAVRKITGIKGAEATSAKEDLYSMGYYGHIGKNPVIAMKNAHKVGTDTFVLDPNKLYVVATDDQFVKFANEGETLIIPGETNEEDE